MLTVNEIGVASISHSKHADALSFAATTIRQTARVALWPAQRNPLGDTRTVSGALPQHILGLYSSIHFSFAASSARPNFTVLPTPILIASSHQFRLSLCVLHPQNLNVCAHSVALSALHMRYNRDATQRNTALTCRCRDRNVRPNFSFFLRKGTRSPPRGHRRSSCKPYPHSYCTAGSAERGVKEQAGRPAGSVRSKGNCNECRGRRFRKN